MLLAENVAGVDRARSAGYRGADCGAGAGFGGGAVGVEGKQAGEHFVADFVGPTAASRAGSVPTIWKCAQMRPMV